MLIYTGHYYYAAIPILLYKSKSALDLANTNPVSYFSNIKINIYEARFISDLGVLSIV